MKEQFKSREKTNIRNGKGAVEERTVIKVSNLDWGVLIGFGWVIKWLWKGLWMIFMLQFKVIIQSAHIIPSTTCRCSPDGIP